MFDITIPIETEKRFLISTLQAGDLKFPETCFLSMPKWRPIDFIRYCISGLEKMLSGEHDRACVPVWFCDFDGATVPSCYWGLNKIDSTTIGFNEIFRFQDDHFESIHSNPEEWWKDVALSHGHWLGMTDCRSIANWLDFYKRLVACAEGKSVERHVALRSERFSLTPFICDEVGRRVCGLQVPSNNCDLLLEAQPSAISPMMYLDCWRVDMIRLLDGECETAVLVLDVDKGNAVTKWIGMARVDSGLLALSKPQERLLGVPLQRGNHSALPTMLSPNMETVVRAVTNWATVTTEDAENWVYWANTVLSGIGTIDDDPDIIPCRCGTKARLANRDL